jgi:hypothetical protein
VEAGMMGEQEGVDAYSAADALEGGAVGEWP